MANCRVCKQPYEPTPYQVRKSDFICLPCSRISAAAWRARRKASGSPVVSTRMPREWEAQYEREYYKDPKVKQRRAELMKKYRNDPASRDKHLARETTRRAIRSGILIKQPCERCANLKVDAHHSDYSQPLKVNWLCRKCHNIEHAQAKGGA